MKRDYLFGEPRDTVRGIVREVAQRAGLSVSDIYGPETARKYSRPRQTAMYLAHKRGGYSLSHIGRIMGRNHTTVMDAVRKVESAPHLYPIGDAYGTN
mgnify:CR=1 FL=1